MRAWNAAVFLWIATVASGAETPRDFAYAMPIAADPGQAFYEVELPPALYRGIAHADLRDIRVFNATDEAVPHALRPRAASTTAAPETVSFPFFPLRGEPAREIGDLRVRVQKRADGTLVDIRSDGRPATSGAVTRGYLLDASRAKEPFRALLFDWKVAREGYSGKVRIEGSDDLTRWSVVVNEATLLDLEFGGHRLEVKRVETRPHKYRYLRVSWPQGQKGLQLAGVRGELVPAATEPVRMWLSSKPPAPGKQPGEYEYDIGGFIPFDRMRIELPQTNTVASVQILVRDKSSEEWRPLGAALVYRLQRDGSEVTSPEIALTSRGQRALLIRVDMKGGGIGSGMPVVQLGWIPQQLVFAARGEAPFRLAYGSHAARDAGFPIQSMLPGYGTEKAFTAKQAKLGAPIALAGEKQLRAPIDYKRWVLWASLILGVAVVGLMAYRLLRQMPSAPGARPPPDSRA